MIRIAGQENRKAEAQIGQATVDVVKPESLIDKHSSFDGHYRSTHNLRIEGAADGEIECESTLTISEEAKVKAKVVAQNVIVGGSLDGEVTCPGRFQILPSGRVVGRVVAGTLEILAGAFYQGELSMHAESGQAPKANGKTSSAVPSSMQSSPLNATTTPALTPYRVPDAGRGNDGVKK